METSNNYPVAELCSDLLKRVRCRLFIDLHPSKLAAVRQGVREYLDGLLLRYNDDLAGVVLSYSNERVLSQSAQVHPYFPYTRVQIAADFVLFRPTVGAKIVGIVNKIADGFIGLVVLGFINVVILGPQIRSEFKAHVFDGHWASTKNPAHKIAVNDYIAFDISGLERHGPYLSLSGSLKQSDTGNIAFTKYQPSSSKSNPEADKAKDQNGGETRPNKSSKRKPEADEDDAQTEKIKSKKKSKADDAVIENGNKEKKKKKRKEQEEPGSEDVKKKKKKSKAA